jgi:hypothetical protein
VSTLSAESSRQFACDLTPFFIAQEFGEFLALFPGCRAGDEVTDTS